MSCAVIKDLISPRHSEYRALYDFFVILSAFGGGGGNPSKILASVTFIFSSFGMLLAVSVSHNSQGL